MKSWLSLLHGIALSTCLLATAHGETPTVLLPKYRLSPAELAVVINDADPLSVRIGRYYQEKRGIPPENIIHVSLPTGRPEISVAEFTPSKELVDHRTPARVQAYALAWANPVRVGCMSITMAFADRYDQAYCAKSSCGFTKFSPYFNSNSTAPRTDHGLRPTVMLAAESFQEAKSLIDRGIRADNSHPRGTACLLDTRDQKRSLRALGYPLIQQRLGDWLPIEVLHTNYLKNKKDVLFYFTGHKKVKHLKTLGFLPGAIADHLTSFGGLLFTSSQMSSLRWLEAGATGSYGTVVEPCAIGAKFPIPEVVMRHYLQGATLLEAYWKSVALPGQGIFIGEPLAAPFGGYHIAEQAHGFELRTRVLKPGNYRLQHAPSLVGPFHDETITVQVRFGDTRFRLPKTAAPVLRFIAQEPPRQYQLLLEP